MSGLFITLEGGEGAGKSTFLEGFIPLLQELVPSDRHMLVTREPGASSIGSTVREILLSENGRPISPETEALLFAADRAQHMSEKIQPMLNAGGVVVCDRFFDSSYAYQGVARGLGNFILDLSLWAIKGRIPDLTILLDIDPEVGIQRKHEQKELNRMEMESLEFHRSVRQSFLDLADKEPSRFLVIDATLPKAEILKIAIEEVKRYI
jgi:dTMP kinase